MIEKTGSIHPGGIERGIGRIFSIGGLVGLLVAFLPVAALAAEIKPRTMECAHEADPVRRNKVCTELIDAGRVKLGDLLWAYNSRAISHFELGNTRAALKDLNAALARNSAFAPAYYTRGEIHRRLGAYQKAVEAFDEAMKTVERGSTWFGSENVDGIVTRNVDLRVSILLSRSSALIELKRLDAAELDCRGALAIHTNDPRPYTNLGFIYSLRGNHEAAERFYAQASALAQGNPKTHVEPTTTSPQSDDSK
jgi:tetratricopeptide (TPR) repeat protein